MSLESVRAVLLWCTIFDYGLLLVWFLAFFLARDWLYQVHTRWFRLSGEQFDALHYAGMGLYKLSIFVLNLAPLLALYIVA